MGHILTSVLAKGAVSNMAIMWCFLLLCLFQAKLTVSDNVGWKAFFTENIDEWHDLPLEWEDKQTPIPDYVTGTFVRNGPARIKFDSDRRIFSSWMDGWAKLHSFKFKGSRVLYSGKMLEPPNYLASVKKGELVPQMTLNKFAHPEDEWSFWEKLEISRKMMAGSGYDNSNPALWRLGPKDAKKGMYLAVTDDPVATQFDIDTLDTVTVHYPPSLPVTISGCAHYMREPGTDNSIMINTRLGLTGPYMEVHRYRPEHAYKDPEVLAKFKPKQMGYFHSFSITEIYMVNLKTGEVTERTTSYLYSIHHANAYETEDGTGIVVDLASNLFENLRDYMKYTNMINPPEHWNRTESNDMTLHRYHIDLKTDGGVRVHVYEDKTPEDYFLNHFDFPIINEEYRGKKYCILYGWSAYLYSRNALVKKNVCDNSLSKVMYLENHYSGEMFFVANPEQKSEDDGVLLATVFDGEKEKSYLLVLDAATFKPLNKAYLPHNIPFSFHGMYFPEAQLGPSKKYARVEETNETNDLM